jgi:hypothetical protein
MKTEKAVSLKEPSLCDSFQKEKMRNSLCKVPGAKCVEAKILLRVRSTELLTSTRNILPVVKHWQKISSPGHITKQNFSWSHGLLKRENAFSNRHFVLFLI